MDLNLEVGNNSIIDKSYAIEFIDFVLDSRNMFYIIVHCFCFGLSPDLA